MPRRAPKQHGTAKLFAGNREHNAAIAKAGDVEFHVREIAQVNIGWNKRRWTIGLLFRILHSSRLSVAVHWL